MHRENRHYNHQRFMELAAVSQAKGLSEIETIELQDHLERCSSCREIYAEYALLHRDGMPFLAAVGAPLQESESWNARAARNTLLTRVRMAERPGSPVNIAAYVTKPSWWQAGRWAVAACLLLGVAAGAYQLGGLQTIHPLNSAPPSASVPDLISGKNASERLLASQTDQISGLQKQLSIGQRDLASLRVALREAQDRSNALSLTDTKKKDELRQVSEQRDHLTAQLRDAETSYQFLQAELTTLRAEHDKTLLHTASLESRITDLSAASHDQDRRLHDNEQYLASDRDIRELMGARKLYIADVFDVDSGSKARKPFGRVFYTQNKSLIFYAFDLDKEPGIKNAGAFQVWGQRDAELSEKPRPMNLGILYMDSEANRRWALRLDDPKQLAEIDAVFVTVEPRGGSQKPTGKPFLYALLRKEANHP